MQLSRILSSLAVAAPLLLVGSPSQATLITYAYTALITSVSPGPTVSGVGAGDTVSGQVTWDTATPFVGQSAGFSVYGPAGGANAMSLDLGGGPLPTTGIQLTIANNLEVVILGLTGSDVIAIGGSFNEDDFMTLSFVDPSATAIADESIPTAIDIGDWTQAALFISLLGHEAQATITGWTAVPEPGAATLLSGGLLLWLALPAIRRRASTR